MEFLDVSSAELRFNLVSGVIDISNLQPVDRSRAAVLLGGRRFEVEVGILGASHFMTIRPQDADDHAQLTEVFACGEVEVAAQRLYFGPLGGLGVILPVTQTLLDGAYTYTFEAWTNCWSPGIYTLVVDLERETVRAQAAKGDLPLGLAFEFPSLPSVDGAASYQRPLTLVLMEVDPRKGELTLRTIHSYPNEERVVFTMTHFTPTPK